MIKNYEWNKMTALEKCQYFAKATVGSRKFTAFRPDNHNSTGGFLRGWVPTMGSRVVTMAGWPECFNPRDEAKARGKIFREACRDYVADPDNAPCPIEGTDI